MAKSLESNKKNVPNKVTTLNPNAAEFVPSAFRATNGNTVGVDSSRVDSTVTSGKVILGRSESSISNNSDDEAHQYWRCQLPDDITPDFKAMREDEKRSPRQLSLAGLSIRDASEPLRFSASMPTETFGMRRDRSPLGTDNLNLSGNMGYPGSPYAEDRSSSAHIASTTNSWDRQFLNGDQRLTKGMEGQLYNGDSSAGFVNNMLGEHAALEDAADPLEFLSSQFPGFSAQSLADIFHANGCDLTSTMDMIGQLELQDGDLNKHLNAKSWSVPSLSKLDMHSFPVAEPHNGTLKYTRDHHQVPNVYRSPSGVFRGSADFGSTARKISLLDGIHWKPERNGSADGSIGSSRNPQFLASLHNGHGKLLYGDKSPKLGTSRAAPLWLESGEAVANMASESREEARNLACLRDACLEQASQAYLIGNKTLARELSEKGHLYNMQMKAAQLKAGETIYRKRDPISCELQGFSRGGQDRVIDLHGLHVSEALHVLKHELNILRSTARAAGQRLQATIYLGTGPHSKSSRISPRLPMAVEQFLIEEGLPYSQPQPGLLHVVIY